MGKKEKDKVKDEERPITIDEAIELLQPDEVVTLPTSVLQILLLSAALTFVPQRPPTTPIDTDSTRND